MNTTISAGLRSKRMTNIETPGSNQTEAQQPMIFLLVASYLLHYYKNIYTSYIHKFYPHSSTAFLRKMTNNFIRTEDFLEEQSQSDDQHTVHHRPKKFGAYNYSVLD
eukprot:Filipodium_phascolosomae@DN4087_c0_g1_i1.p1